MCERCDERCVRAIGTTLIEILKAFNPGTYKTLEEREASVRGLHARMARAVREAGRLSECPVAVAAVKRVFDEIGNPSPERLLRAAEDAVMGKSLDHGGPMNPVDNLADATALVEEMKALEAEEETDRMYLVKLVTQTTALDPVEAARQGAYFARKWNDGAEHLFEVTDKLTGEVTHWRAVQIGKGVAWQAEDDPPEEDTLGAAIRHVEQQHPLPRCGHGSALRDGGGERLEPPCGCRAAKGEE
jgi:hypothetical protein